uniref:stage II sporulation protein M n=1 Tax=Marinobacterium profundum TaxID=1714300 RepID=UPI00082DD40E|nr:stage II sporulation protein M [Marinobacterium profundum]
MSVKTEVTNTIAAFFVVLGCILLSALLSVLTEIPSLFILAALLGIVWFKDKGHRQRALALWRETSTAKKFWVGFAALLVYGMISSAFQEPPQLTAEQAHVQRIEQHFSKWDGSHEGLTPIIKASMHNPESYEHVKTTYVDGGETLQVTTAFRGTNAFGAVVTQSAYAVVDLNGNVLSHSLQ